MIPPRDTTIPAVPTESDHQRGFQLFSRHWMDAVFETSVPPRRAPLTSLEMFASPGEYEPAAFGLHALRELAAVSLTAGPLVSDSGYEMPGPDLRVARNMALQWGSDRTAVLVPVILEQRPSYTITEATSRFCWVTVHVPDNAPAGMYRSEITVSVEDSGAAVIPLNVQVLPVRLVSAQELDQSYGFWLWHFEAPPPYAPDPLASFKDMIAHGMNSVHFGTDEEIPFVKTDQGYSRSLKGTSWDVFMNAAKRAGFSKPLLVSTDDIAANAAKVFPYIGGMVDLVMTDHLGKWPIKANKLEENPDFEQLFCQGVAQIMAEFKQRGLPEPIFGIGDEMMNYEYYTHRYLDPLIHRGGGTAEMGWFDVSTLKEPYRIEGKKTMGLELAEQFGWDVPDVIFYPTGGGTGLIGMWKAFDELEQIGWLGEKRPRMVAVQASGCAPIVKAYEDGADHAVPWKNAHTIAAGIRVPAAIGDFLILRAIRESNGFAIAVDDDAILASRDEMARREGLLLCPEGAATYAAYKKALDSRLVSENESALLYNCATGLKYELPAVDRAIDRHRPIDYTSL